MSDQLDEALDLLSTGDGLLNEIDRHNADAFVSAVAVVLAAARAYVRDWITCPTCGGTELLDAKSYEIPGVCPDCVDGMTPSPEALERGKAAARRRLAQTWHDDDLTAHVREILLASRREGEA